jgi:hypothetical protein
MTPISIVVAAFFAALFLASLTFMGGAVPLAIPAVVLLIAAIGWGIYGKRNLTPKQSSSRYEHEREHAEGGDHVSPGDTSTIYTGDPNPDAR